MADDRLAPNLQALESDYEIRGELRGTDSARYYIGRTRDERAAEVAITVVTAPKGDTAALSHFASDAQILESGAHPAILRVLDGKWVGKNEFALITERMQGDTLDELLDRAEKFSNPRAASILQEVNAALDWARDAGVVHRGVTPDSLLFERDGGRVRLSLLPTPIPMTGIPDACSDARTIGTLAWAILTGKPHTAGETRSIGEVCPNLAQRVIDATDKMVRCKDHADAPDVGTYLGILAAGDVLKQAEVELAAQKEEYDEQHRIALQQCELQRQETEQHAAEQASILAGEREDFKREIEETRAAVAAERAEFESIMAERKERFAAVRAELDQQRTELERRLAELEAYRVEVEKVREEAIAAREAAHDAAKQAQAKASEFNAATQAFAKSQAEREAALLKAQAERDAQRESQAQPHFEREVEVPKQEEIEVAVPPVPPAMALDVPRIDPFEKPKLAKPPKAPKWSKIDRVDLESTDLVTPKGRPRWMLPSAVATFVVIAAAGAYGLTHRTPRPDDRVKLGTSTVVPTTAAPAGSNLPRGGFLTQTAGGSLGPRIPAQTSPAISADSAAKLASATPVAPATAASPRPDSAARSADDSVAAAAAARAKRAAAREAARQEEARREKAIRDSAAARPASLFDLPSRDTAVKRDTVVKRDTLIKRDTTRPPVIDTVGVVR